jgi:hypothetical protein
LREASEFAYDRVMAECIRPLRQEPTITIRNAQTMTGTPTTTVTAITIVINAAARAFAWGAGMSPGGRLSDHGSGTLPRKSQ